MRKFAITILIGVLASLGFIAPAQAHNTRSIWVHSSHKGLCVATDIPVSASVNAPSDWQVAVTYCQPFRWAQEHQIDVLTPGATYTGEYWDWKQQPELYSYVGRTLADGRATLAYDRIGNGASGRTDGTRPLSTEITMTSDAYVLHQLISKLWFLGYRHINSISHSYGSGVALAEATTDYGDDIKVKSLVLSGYLHRPSNPAVTAGNYPANLDPKFAHAGLDGGYLTSRPGVRGTSFHAPTSDPVVVAYDEDNKDVVSLTGLLGFLSARSVPAISNISSLVTVPVLVVNGQLDAIFCYDPVIFNCSDDALVQANEAPFYLNVEVRTVPGSGHDLTLHTSAGESYGMISTWLQGI